MLPRILLVEDNPDHAQVMTRKLKRRGFELFVAQNGQEALTMAVSEPTPHVILMDFDLPGDFNGIETTKKLKQLPQVSVIPVIAVSANIDYRAKSELDDAGFFNYCLKPVDYDKLFRLLTLALRSNPLYQSEEPATA